MRNLAWSVIVLGMTSTAAMAQEPAPRTSLASAAVSPAALPALAASVVLGADQAAAPAPAPKRATLTTGIDFPTAYMFRGIFQEDEGFITQPFVDLGIRVVFRQRGPEGRHRQRG